MNTGKAMRVLAALLLLGLIAAVARDADRTAPAPAACQLPLDSLDPPRCSTGSQEPARAS